MLDIYEKKLRSRFVDSFPIQVVHSPYFEERLKLLNPQFKCLDKWNDLMYTLYRSFNGNQKDFLDYYGKVKEETIASVRNNEAFKIFNNCDMSVFAHPKYPSSNLYTSLYNGEKFISFDLAKANFQAMKFFDKDIVFGCDTYEEFIGKYTDVNYIKDSKYLRERIFGELNPKRTYTVETYLIHLIISEVFSKIDWLQEHFDLVIVNHDEAIYKLRDKADNVWEIIDDDLLGDAKKTVSENPSTLGIIIKAEKFELKQYQFGFECSDAHLDVYRKVMKDTVTDQLLCCPNIYYAQVYKRLNGLEVTENDLTFYNNHELARFLNPLKLETIDK